jgi:predicted nucleic acid-binding protein
MEKAFPDASVERYESLITSLQVPDENDRHILAAAIRCKADVIVTSNLKDFPVKDLE